MKQPHTSTGTNVQARRYRRLKSLNVRLLVVIALALSAGCTGPAESRTVDVLASDGLVLKATVFATARPGPAVLLLHQCDEQRKVWDSLGVKLMRAGITALSFDYRGYGESGGTPHDKVSPEDFERQQTDQWPADVDSAYAMLLRQPGVEPDQIGVASGSCGVMQAMQLAERRHDIKGLVLLAGGIDARGRAFIGADSAPPILAGAAADDKYANFVEIMSWYAALSKNKQSRVMQYADGGHAAVVFGKHPEFADSIAKWFSAVLRIKPDQLPGGNGKPLSADVVATLNELDQPGGPGRVEARLLEARKQSPTAQLFPEYFVNVLGYEHIQARDVEGAIAIMKLNTVAYPNSPNAFDSLGDIYNVAGDRAKTIEAATHALKLLETDTVDTPERKVSIESSAVAKLKQLGVRK